MFNHPCRVLSDYRCVSQHSAVAGLHKRPFVHVSEATVRKAAGRGRRPEHISCTSVTIRKKRSGGSLNATDLWKSRLPEHKGRPTYPERGSSWAPAGRSGPPGGALVCVRCASASGNAAAWFLTLPVLAVMVSTHSALCGSLLC